MRKLSEKIDGVKPAASIPRTAAVVTFDLIIRLIRLNAILFIPGPLYSRLQQVQAAQQNGALHADGNRRPPEHQMGPDADASSQPESLTSTDINPQRLDSGFTSIEDELDDVSGRSPQEGRRREIDKPSPPSITERVSLILSSDEKS